MVEIDADGSLSVSAQWEGSSIEAPITPWTCPLSASDLEDLRWYLEDFLIAPFAVYQQRGDQIAGRLAEWGDSLFSSLFRDNSTREVYARAHRQRGTLQIIIKASEGHVLALPWELIKEPGHTVPLALDGVAITRVLRADEIESPRIIQTDRIRVLMVIARPAGRHDIGYRMIARRLQRLLTDAHEVDLTVLRPPTFAQFERVLAAAALSGEPFQVVHFDGHGAFAASTAGALVFEGESGGPRSVGAEDVGRALADVPIVVLNACKSGQVGADLEAGIATNLLSAGVSSVVAMAYSVYAAAAAEFMAVFYKRLFAGDAVAAAVTTARAHLATANERVSLKGKVPLADWMIPVHFARQDVHLPGPGMPATDATKSDLIRGARYVARPRSAEMVESAEIDHDLALAALDGVFVGRDGLLYSLDATARLCHVVLLHGQAGVGKTELAKEFARWWRDTNGVERPEWVVWHSFESGLAATGLDGAISAAGLHIVGPEFVLLNADQRRESLLKLLETRRILLIWDNFESLYSLPDLTRAAAPLDFHERAEVEAFLSQVRARAAGAIVITSRTREDWLGELERIEVENLEPSEAIEYADHLLAPHPLAQAARQDPAFGALLAWLDGHPLSMRLTLGQLDRAHPNALLERLKGIASTADTSEYTRILVSSIEYSFSQLPRDCQDALVVVALINGTIWSPILENFSLSDETLEQCRGLDLESWERVLGQASEVGLLTSNGAFAYRIHPALPAYLARRWRTFQADEFERQYALAERIMLLSYVAFSEWLDKALRTENTVTALQIIEQQEANLIAMLGHALDRAMWAHAQLIIQPLNEYWQIRDRAVDAYRWISRANQAVSSAWQEASDPDSPAGELWLFSLATEANWHYRTLRLDESESLYRTVLEALLQGNSLETLQQESTLPGHLARLGVVCHQFGVVAQRRGNLDQAKSWFQRALALKRADDDGRAALTSLHGLGMIAQAQGEWDSAKEIFIECIGLAREFADLEGLGGGFNELARVERNLGNWDAAEHYYWHALKIWQELDNRRAMALTTLELGNLAHARRILETAEYWYRKSLVYSESLGNQEDSAKAYHGIGTIAYMRCEYELAEEWCQQALRIYADQHSAAASYHLLGMIRGAVGDAEGARNAYHRSLAISGEHNDRNASAATLHQLGVLAHALGDRIQARDLYLQSAMISEELGNPENAAAAFGQLGALAEEDGDERLALQWAVRWVWRFGHAYLAIGTCLDDLRRLTSRLGMTVLEQTWRQITGESLPTPIRRLAAPLNSSDGEGDRNE